MPGRGSSHVVIFSWWLAKYGHPVAESVKISQFSGNPSLLYISGTSSQDIFSRITKVYK